MTMRTVEPRARPDGRPFLSNPFEGASDTFIGIEKFAVLIQCEAVGHPGDVIGDHARERLAVDFNSAQHVARHLARLAHVSLEQALEHPARLAGRPAAPEMTVPPLAHQLLDLFDHPCNSRAEVSERP